MCVCVCVFCQRFRSLDFLYDCAASVAAPAAAFVCWCFYCFSFFMIEGRLCCWRCPVSASPFHTQFVYIASYICGGPRLQPVTVWQAHGDASERCHAQLLGRICVCVELLLLLLLDYYIRNFAQLLLLLLLLLMCFQYISLLRCHFINLLHTQQQQQQHGTCKTH